MLHRVEAVQLPDVIVATHNRFDFAPAIVLENGALWRSYTAAAAGV